MSDVVSGDAHPDTYSARFLADDRLDPAAEETKRIQELFKYFLAAFEASGSKWNDIDSQATYDPNTARISSDPILNALTQLAACRLRCDRAFISLIDDEHQYVITEATREISLYDATIHPAKAGLCIGTRPLDLFSGVCAETMPAFTDAIGDGPYRSTANIYADCTRYVINDFALEDKYKDRPYVEGFPFMRYYAEVPVTSSSGWVIGTLAVVDNEPRVGLSEENFFILTEIAKTVMKHLEKIKIERDHQQASRLLQGLKTFAYTHAIEEKAQNSNTSMRTPPPMLQKHDSGLESSAASARNLSPENSFKVDFDRDSRQPSSLKPEPMQTSLPAVKPPSRFTAPSYSGSVEPGKFEITSADNNSTDLTSQSMLTPSDLDATKLDVPDSEVGAQLRELLISDQVRIIVSNASHIIREAMDLDGVAFLDAAPSSFNSYNVPELRNDHLDLDSHSAEHSSRASDDEGVGPATFRTPKARSTRTKADSTTSETQYTSQRSLFQDKISGRLGYSTRQSLNKVEPVISSQHFSLPELVLRSLIRLYPKGRVFDFNQESFESTEGKPSQDSFNGKFDFDLADSRRILRRSELRRAIRHALPTARAAFFYPLWNPHKSCWFAAALGWIETKKRMFHKDDLAYFSVFGSSLMAEVTKSELLANDAAKFDFISSISHELRSPLHGILGSVDILREGVLNPSQQELITMVENCGRTMLDSMEHILDFAKISRGEPKEYNRRSGKSGRRHQSAQIEGSESTFNLATVVEETVHSLVAGHRYNITSAQSSNKSPWAFKSYADLVQAEPLDTPGPEVLKDVSVVLDIEPQLTWLVKSQIAAWRRIILNLLGNSLKYTSKGLIEIVLLVCDSRSALIESKYHKSAVLTVRDTGCGIGKFYLQNQLYRPFSQENDVASGTGLGLSIVKSIVNDLHGVIDVQSDVKYGTQVEVLIPLDFQSDSATTTTTLVPQKYRGTEVCLLDLNIYPMLDDIPDGILSARHKRAVTLRKILENYFQYWLGMRVTSSSDVDSSKADVFLVSEENLQLLSAHDQNEESALEIPQGASILVLRTENTGKRQAIAMKSERVQYIDLPFGPRSLREAVTNALLADRSRTLLISRKPHSEKQLPTNNSETYLDANAKFGSSQTTDSAILPAEKQDRQKRKLSNTPKLRLLVVDDNQINIKLIVAQLHRLDCECFVATNGQEARDLYEQSNQVFDYILMDISMPVMNGFQASRAIRHIEQMQKRPAVPIIALTGLSDVKAQHEAFASGMNYFFTKPVPMKKIIALVEEGLAGLQDLPGPDGVAQPAV